MGEYKGQPNYVVADYLKDLFEHWIPTLTNDEWGEQVEAMWQLLAASISVDGEDYQVALLTAGWIKAELDRAFEQDWWGVKEDYDDWRSVYAAQDQFESTTDYWRKRAVSFKGEAALEETIAGLPDWIRPMPDRLERPDSERKEYERLKAKFEKESGATG